MKFFKKFQPTMEDLNQVQYDPMDPNWPWFVENNERPIRDEELVGIQLAFARQAQDWFAEIDPEDNPAESMLFPGRHCVEWAGIVWVGASTAIGDYTTWLGVAEDGYYLPGEWPTEGQ